MVDTGTRRRQGPLIDLAAYYLRAPDLIVGELANILWKKQVRGEITAREMSPIRR
jgi:predicted nucleic acid-binding protein